MRCYSITETDVTDRTWIAEYVQNVTRLVEQLGGRFLARTSKIESPKENETFRSLCRSLNVVWQSTKFAVQ